MKVDSQNGERQKLKKLYKYNSFKKDSVSEPSAWDLVRLGKIFLGFCNFLARSWQDILPRNAKFCKIFHDHGKANKKNLGFLAKTNKRLCQDEQEKSWISCQDEQDFDSFLGNFFSFFPNDM